jgi:hypothetical protein
MSPQGVPSRPHTKKGGWPHKVGLHISISVRHSWLSERRCKNVTLQHTYKDVVQLLAGCASKLIAWHVWCPSLPTGKVHLVLQQTILIVLVHSVPSVPDAQTTERAGVGRTGVLNSQRPTRPGDAHVVEGEVPIIAFRCRVLKLVPERRQGEAEAQWGDGAASYGAHKLHFT